MRRVMNRHDNNRHKTQLNSTFVDPGRCTNNATWPQNPRLPLIAHASALLVLIFACVFFFFFFFFFCGRNFELFLNCYLFSHALSDGVVQLLLTTNDDAIGMGIMIGA
jgi:hypothetical protein